MFSEHTLLTVRTTEGRVINWGDSAEKGEQVKYDLKSINDAKQRKRVKYMKTWRKRDVCQLSLNQRHAMVTGPGDFQDVFPEKLLGTKMDSMGK